MSATRVLDQVDLVNWMAKGCKPDGPMRVGTEHEKILFRDPGFRPVPYAGPCGVNAILEKLHEATGWKRICEHDAIIGLLDTNGGASISLEPGGQLELSGAPLYSAHETNSELTDHLKILMPVLRNFGLAALGLGAAPTWHADDMPRMPKRRYGIMAPYLKAQNELAIDMMFCTATAQVNLDYTSEDDMVTKMRVGVGLQPVVQALFSNSPFRHGAPSSYLSTRSHYWRHFQKSRSGFLSFVLENGMGFEKYVDWALQAPMFFVYRDGIYHDVSGHRFSDFIDGRIRALPDLYANLDDWEMHLSTLFPEVRLKRIIEMRGADMGPPAMVPALAAFWLGLMYDTRSLAEASSLVGTWDVQEIEHLHEHTPTLGLRATINHQTTRDIASQLISLADDGLRRRNIRDVDGQTEAIYLQPLKEIVDRGTTQADEWLMRYQHEWNRQTHMIFDAARF